MGVRLYLATNLEGQVLAPSLLPPLPPQSCLESAPPPRYGPLGRFWLGSGRVEVSVWKGKGRQTDMVREKPRADLRDGGVDWGVVAAAGFLGPY